jgi:hypothetical protein
VLIPPPGIVRIYNVDRTVKVWMTRQQIEDSPPIDEHRPLSRQQEASLYRYWGFPLYGTAPHASGAGALPEFGAGAMHPPGALLDQSYAPPSDDRHPPQGDDHLRSAREVIGYHVQASDGDLGHVDDLCIDDADWSLKEIVIDTRNWWPGRHVRVPADVLDRVSQDDRTITVRLTRREIETRPEVEA